MIVARPGVVQRGEAMKPPAWMKTETDRATGIATVWVRRWHPGFWLWLLRYLLDRLRRR